MLIGVWAIVVFIVLLIAAYNTDLPTEITETQRRDNRVLGSIIIAGIVIAIPLFVVLMFYILTLVGVI